MKRSDMSRDFSLEFMERVLAAGAHYALICGDRFHAIFERLERETEARRQSDPAARAQQTLAAHRNRSIAIRRRGRRHIDDGGLNAMRLIQE